MKDTIEIDEEDQKLVERLAPKIEERVRYKVVRSIIDALEEQFYPPEEMFREEFIKSVEEAEHESGRIFKNREELKEHLESLAEDDV